MINEKLSNIKPVANAYNNVEKKVAGILKELRDNYEEVYAEQPWARSNNSFLFVWYLLWSIAAIVGLVLWDDLCAWLTEYTAAAPEVRDFILINNIFFVLKLACMAILVGSAYAAVKIFFCMKMKKYGKRVGKLEKKVPALIENYKNNHSINDIRNSIEQRKSISFSDANTLGNEIRALKKNVAGLRERIYTYKKIANIIIAVAVAGIVAHGMIYGLRPIMDRGLNFSFGFATFVMLLVASEAVVVIMMNVGPYIGKFTKPLGILLSAVLALVYYGFMRGIAAEANTPELLKAMNFNSASIRTISVMFPGLMFIGMVLVVCFTNLGNELDKLKNGYVVEMAYGSDKQSGKIRVFILGICYAIMCLAYASVVCVSVAEIQIMMGVLAVFWWAINPLMHPRGNRLYAFWGRGRCIANEVVLFFGCIIMITAYEAKLDFHVLLSMLGVVGISIIVGGIAKFINDRVIL